MKSRNHITGVSNEQIKRKKPSTHLEQKFSGWIPFKSNGRTSHPSLSLWDVDPQIALLICLVETLKQIHRGGVEEVNMIRE